jgi:basic membrane protein A
MVRKVAMCFGFGGLPSSYNDMGLKGLQMAKKEFGILFDFYLPETGTDIEDYIRRCSRSEEYDLILAMGFASGKPVHDVAVAYPDQKFMVLDALVNVPNVASYVSNQVDIGFYTGYVAALITMTRKIGSVWGSDYPIMRRWIAGIVEGAKHADLGVEVLHSFVGSWANSVTAKKLAMAQFRDGADIVVAHSTEGDSGIIQAAQDMNLYVIGFGDARSQDSNRILFDVVRHAEVAVYGAIKAVFEDNFKGNQVFSCGLSEGHWDLTLKDAHSLVTEGIKLKAENIRNKIITSSVTLPNTNEEIEVSLAKSKEIRLKFM